MKRRASASPEHGVEHVAERALPDEEREGLVLVRRPCVELGEQEGGDTGGRTGDADPKGSDGHPRLHSGRE